MYHSIADIPDDPYQVTVSPARFTAQLRWLADRGLCGVDVGTLRHAVAAHEDTRRMVGLSFDDGYADFADTAVPILTDFGFTATVYVLAGQLGGVNNWDRPGPCKALMTAEQVRAVADAGMEIGSHGMTHRSLPTLSPAELTVEVTRSRTELRALTGQRVDGFAYPYGHAEHRELTSVARAGYTHAVSVNGAPEHTSRYALARTFIGEADTGPRLRARQLRHHLSGRH